jgi:hypothetical protein
MIQRFVLRVQSNYWKIPQTFTFVNKSERGDITGKSFMPQDSYLSVDAYKRARDWSLWVHSFVEHALPLFFSYRSFLHLFWVIRKRNGVLIGDCKRLNVEV